ncbi:hypothetical protein HY498_01660 [Candidatus Woesearchaeota archaeon]|nr:hypothetical protein [Candidatus Woesearchaeota archaeon]
MENYNTRREFLSNLGKLGGIVIASTIPSFLTGCGNKEYEIKIMKTGSPEKAEPVKLEISPIEILVDEYSTKLSAGTLNKTPVALGIVDNELYCIENPTDLFQKLDDKLYLDGDAVLLGNLEHEAIRKRGSSSKQGKVNLEGNDVFHPVYLEDKVIEIRTGNKNIGFRSRKIPAVKVTNQACSSSVVYAFFTIPGEESIAGSLYAVENPVFDIDGNNNTVTLNNKCKRIIVKGEGAEYKSLRVILGSVSEKENQESKGNKDTEEAKEDAPSEQPDSK